VILLSFDFKVRDKEVAGTLVPRMSPLLVRAWMERNATLIPAELLQAAVELINLNSVTFWNTFEKFHALYECMRHVLLSLENTKQSIALKDLYPGALVSSDSILDHTILLRPRTLVTLNDNLDLTPVECAKHLGHVVLPGPNNPGFDIAVPIKEGEWLLIEARFSQPDSSTLVVIKEDAIKKREKIVTSVTTLKLPGADRRMSCD
jgi:hypothetical protein